MKFIDLFAGLGGFHCALSSLGHKCVFASEKKEALALLYEHNFGIPVNRDIRDLQARNIPKHDILCAGFPCQPFSKAGKQKGLEDQENGSYFDIIIKILSFHKPKYFILENVRNLESHDKFKTWDYISLRLEELGYEIDKRVLSPHKFNIPQHRERLFIVGSLNGLDQFKFPTESNLTSTVADYLIPSNAHRKLEKEKVMVLDVWQQFLDVFPKNESLPGFPIWSMEFGANYPFEEFTPFSLTSKHLSKFSGCYGVSFEGLSKKEMFNNLPSYARTEQKIFPIWKQNYIRKNREFYARHTKILKPLVNKLRQFENSSWQKFEWNCGNAERQISSKIIQFRASGVRIKKADFFPSLVTVSTQVPIIGWEGRYLSPEEGAAIQSVQGIKLPKNIGTSFGALGNAVNAELVRLIAENLFNNIPKKNRIANISTEITN